MVYSIRIYIRRCQSRSDGVFCAFVKESKAGIGEQKDSTISDRYDYCIFNNPPDIGINVVNALVVTDEVIVPVKIDENALEGLDIVAEQIEDARVWNPSLTLKGILVTK